MMLVYMNRLFSNRPRRRPRPRNRKAEIREAYSIRLDDKLEGEII